MAIPDAVIEDVRVRGDLVEIVSEVTTLKRSGRTFRGPCPLHGGKGPNFSVDPTRNVFKCFVCGEGGDLFSFPMKHFGMDFLDAVRWVAARVGVEIPEEDRRRPEDDPNAPYHEANAFAAAWFRDRLLDEADGREAREYLERRGITPEIRERFGIGWAPEEWAAFGDAARRHGIPNDLLIELGLLKRSTREGREPYDAFRGRIIFPIEDLGGRVVAFGGRVIGSVEEHIPKYLNSPESPVYHKGETLYGLRWSRGVIRKEEMALIVEGYMDYVSLASHGVENVVAPLGTALTQAQAEAIARYAPRAALLYDSDAAGVKATFRAGDELLRAGVEVLVVTLPDGADPDSLVRTGGPQALRSYIRDAVAVLERKVQILERRGYFESIALKRRAVDALLPTVRAAADDVLRGLYIARIAERTGIPAATIEAEVAAGGTARGRHRMQTRDATQEQRRRRASNRAPEPHAAAPRLGAEKNLVLLLLRDEQWLERAAERLVEADFLDPTYRAIFAELLHLHAEGAPREGEWLAAFPDDVAARVQDLLADPEGANLAHPDRFFAENVQKIESRDQERRLQEINQELEGAAPERQHELLREKANLLRTMGRSGAAPRAEAAPGAGE